MIAVRKTCLPLLVTPLALAACNEAYDPRGVDRDETLLSVSATGESEVRPDEAFFQVGVENFARTGKAASDANAQDIREVVAALREAGVPADDIQTRTVGIQRIQYGDDNNLLCRFSHAPTTIGHRRFTGLRLAPI